MQLYRTDGIGLRWTKYEHKGSLSFQVRLDRILAVVSLSPQAFP